MISGVVMLNHQVAGHRDPRTTKQLQPQMFAVQRGNGASVLGTIGSTEVIYNVPFIY